MTGIAAARRRALDYLLGGQEPQGWWADFMLAPGRSTLWVTAYVGVRLAQSGAPEARAAAVEGWRFLRRWARDGWGYSQLTPPDADSTAWALGLAAAIDAPQNGPVPDARRLLAACRRPDGGLSTYPGDQEIRRFIGAAPDLSFAGWCGSCVCVTAAAARLGLAGPEALDFLARAQRPDGSWASHWWVEDEYATTMAALALARHGSAEDATRVVRAARWAAGRLGRDGSAASAVQPEGSAFATALVLELLAACPVDCAAASRAATWLAGRQDESGRWPPSAGLRVPPPDAADPTLFAGWISGGMREGAITLDQDGMFTAATAFAALTAWSACADARTAEIGTATSGTGRNEQ